MFQDAFLAAMEVDLLFEEDEEELAEEVLLKVVRRNLRDVLNPFELPESSFKDIFRFSKATAQYVVDQLIPHLQQPQRCTAVPPFLRVSITILLFYC